MISVLTDAAVQLAELTPLVRRISSLDPATPVRVSVDAVSASVLGQLPFRVLVGRTVLASWPADPLDVTVAAAELLAWLDGESSDPPDIRDATWRAAVPPTQGWRRLEVIPDTVLRDLVRTGVRALTEAAEREGIPGAQPRAATADALLDSTVLTVAGDDDVDKPVGLTLRLISAVIRMGFVPRGSNVAVDVSGRWLRAAGTYGSGYDERPGHGLRLLR